MTRRALLMVLLTWFLGNLSIHLVTPALPELADVFHTTPRFVQLSISIFLLGKALSMLFWGVCSEHIGRKPIFLLGLVLYSISNLLTVASDHIGFLLVCRFIQGIAVGATLLMGRSMVNDCHSEQQATRRFAMLFTLAGALICFLPYLGGLLNTNYSWRAPFLLMSIYALFLFIIGGVRETKSNYDVHTSLKASRATVLKHPLFVGYLLVSALMMAGESAFNTSASFILIKNAGFSVKSYGTVKTIMALAHLVGTAICGLLVRYVSSARLVGIGVRFFVIASGCMWLFNQTNSSLYISLILPMTIYHFGTGFIVASTAAAVVRPFPQQMAIALAFCLFLQFIFSAFFSLLGSLAAIQTAPPFTLLLSLISLCAWFAWRCLIINRSPQQAQVSLLAN